MLNDDVLALIKSYSGITSLDVADAVRELKREGISIQPFKMRELSRLCFLLQYKFVKKPGNVSYQWLKAESLQTDLHLLAFKLLGFNYAVDLASFKFRVDAVPLNRAVWGFKLRRLYKKEKGWCPFTLLELINSKSYKKQILEKLFVRELF
jgi:hypothetical protein